MSIPRFPTSRAKLLFSLTILIASTLVDSILPNAAADERTGFDRYFADNLMRGAISPDGKHYAYGLREGTDLFLCLLDLETKKVRRVKVGEDAHLPNDIEKIIRPARMSYLNWASSDRIIYKPDGYRLFSIGLQLEEPVEMLLYDGQDSFKVHKNGRFYAFRTVRNLLPDEPDYILVESTAIYWSFAGHWSSGNQYDIYLVNIHTGAAVPMSGEFGAQERLFLGADGSVRATEKTRRNESIELRVAHPETRELTPIRELVGDEIVDEYQLERTREKGLDAFLKTAVILDFGYNPEWMFFASNANRDKYAIFAIHLLTREVQGPIAEDDRFDIVYPRNRLDYSTLRHSYATRNLIGIRTHFEKPTDMWVDDTLVAILSEVDAQLPGTTNRLSGWSDDRKKYTVEATGGEWQWQTLLYDSESKSLETILEGPPAKSITVPIWIPSSQGHQLLCYLSVPKSIKQGAPNKTVALFHGGPWARDYMGPSDEERLLVEQGYTVLQVNFRGSIGFGKKFTLSARHRFGDAALEDVVTAIDWCIANKLSQPGNIVAMGASYGGFLALYASAKRPDLFRRTVAISAVTNLVKIIQEDRFDSSRDWAAYIFNKEMIGHPRKERQNLEAQSPFYLNDKFVHPVLLIHGLDDSVVPASHSRSLFKKLEKRSKNHVYLPIEDAGHGRWTPDQLDEIYGTIVDFIEE